MWFPVSLPSLLKKAPERRPESPPVGPKEPAVPFVSWPHVPFLHVSLSLFVLFVLTEAPPAGKVPAVGVKAMPWTPPVSHINLLQTVFVNCVLECLA